jgi:hypothetical protein
MGEKTKHVDFLIVGGGIAGTTLALELQKLGASVTIYDNQFNRSSSRVAAGLISAMVPRNVRKTWLSDQIFPHVFNYYKSFEDQWNEHFIDEIPTLQIHKNLRQVHNWTIRAGEPGFEKYLNINAPQLPECMKPLNFDCIEVLLTGRLDVTKFIDLAKVHIPQKENSFYFEGQFHYNELIGDSGDWIYEEIKYSKVVFADGVNIHLNPFFNYLPFNPSGGDILKVKIEGIPQSHILKKKEWLLPIGNNEWLAGSTYHSDNYSTQEKESDSDWLIQELESWVGKPIQLIEHKRGVRPTVAERRPYLGEHPIQQNLFVYNGLGSKGSSLVSVLSEQFAQHLFNQAPLYSEVNIEQYHPLFFAKTEL